MVQETWLVIPGYESHYEASSQGNIRSVKDGKNLILRLSIQKGRKTNYKTVSLSKNGNVRRYLVSRLVLAAFKGLDLWRPDLFACHIDDNGENNSIENLFIGTVFDNVHDAMNKGRLDNSGSKNGMSKFTEKQVLEMRRLFSNGAKLKEVMEKFNISMTGAHHIKSGKRWGFLK